MNECVWVSNDLHAASGTDSQWLPLINSTEPGLATEKSFPRPKTSLTHRQRGYQGTHKVTERKERERGTVRGIGQFLRRDRLKRNVDVEF